MSRQSNTNFLARILDTVVPHGSSGHAIAICWPK